MSVADTLKRKFGANLSESLGVRNQSAIATPALAPVVATSSPDFGRTRAREAGHMEIEQIVPDPNQPRKEFDPDALDSLAASLKRHGQLLPVRVRWNADLGKWVIISGERRYQAAKRSGLKTLACVFVDKELSPTEILQEQIVENLLREDLKPIEQAKAYKTLMEMQGWNGSQLAEALHISKATVSRVLTLLKLPEDVQKQVDQGEIPSTAAYEVAKLPSEIARREMAERIVSEGMNRRDAVDAVREVVDQAEQVVSPPTPIREVHPAEPVGERLAPVMTKTSEERTPSKPAAIEVSQKATHGEDDSPPEIQTAPARKKRGKPRGSARERSYRVEIGARVVVSFSKKIPTTDETIAALEQAISQVRNEAARAVAA